MTHPRQAADSRWLKPVAWILALAVCALMAYWLDSTDYPGWLDVLIIAIVTGLLAFIVKNIRVIVRR